MCRTPRQWAWRQSKARRRRSSAVAELQPNDQVSLRLKITPQKLHSPLSTKLDSALYEVRLSTICRFRSLSPAIKGWRIGVVKPSLEQSWTKIIVSYQGKVKLLFKETQLEYGNINFSNTQCQCLICHTDTSYPKSHVKLSNGWCLFCVYLILSNQTNVLNLSSVTIPFSTLNGFINLK